MSITDESLEAVKKMILDNHGITIREVSDVPMVPPKLLNFNQKQHSMDNAQEMLTTSNDDPNLLKKVITDHECVAKTSKPKPNHHNGSVHKSQNRKKHVKFDEMLRFFSLFSSIAMACCIINS